jgi:hypothetical protein
MRRPVLGATPGFSDPHPGDVIDGFRLTERLHVGGATSSQVAPMGDEVETGPDSGFGFQISGAGIDARRHRR